MWRKNISLKIKILWGTIGIVFLTGLAITLFIIASVQPKLLDKLQKRGVYIAQNIASYSVNPILTEKFFELTLMINEQKKQVEDIEYIYILDENRTVIAHTFGGRFPVQLKNLNHIPSEKQNRIYYLNTEQGEIMHIAIPLMEGNAGSLHLGLTEKSIKQDLSDILMTLMLFIFGVLVAGISIAFLFARTTTKPLSEVASVIRSIGSKNLYQKLNVSTSDEIGELSRAFNTMIELRIETEGALQLSKAIQMTQQETSREGMLVVDEKGEILSYNQRFVDMWKIPDEIIKTKSEESILQYMLDKVMTPDEYLKRVRYLNNNHHERSYEEIALIDGTIFNCQSAPVTGTDDKYYGRVWHFCDITEQKKLRMLQAQKMEAIGRLAGGIAHDFKNLLSSIIGYAHLAFMKIGSYDPLLPNIEQIIKAANKAAQLTNNLFEFSRKQTMDMKSVNLNRIISKAEKVLRRLLNKNIDLTIETPANELMVFADSSQIEQVLINLAENARDAMPNGGRLTIRSGTVEFDAEQIKAYDFEEPGMYAVISVTDSGIGMDKEKIDKIFEPFFTAEEVNKERGQSLAIVYGIVRQHNGHISISSEPGKGTTFRTYLPCSTPAGQKLS